MPRAVILLLTILASSACSPANEIALDVAAPINDGMVIQRHADFPVTGTAEPGAQVHVTLADQTHAGQAGDDGRFRVELPPLDAGGPYTLTIEAAGERLEIRDVLVGDVWLCSGQSNMEWVVEHSLNARQEVAAAGDPKIRHFKVPRSWAMDPSAELAGGAWKRDDPEHAGAFTAVGYFFARALRRQHDVQIGLINSTWGGSRIEAWMSAEALGLNADQLKEVLSRESDLDDRRHKVPTMLYNKMVHPLLPYPVKGVLWYQGESNAGPADAFVYRDLFAAMIRSWRESRGASELPFLFVQLANFLPPAPAPIESDWAALRESQSAALALPATGQAVAIDAGDADDIHPLDKQVVGERLALAARKVAYGEDIVHSGPVYRDFQIRSTRMVIAFDHTGDGLVARDSPDGRFAGFAIAGDDRRFVWAEAAIEGDGIAVWSDLVPAPVAVRYAWADNPEGANLYNLEGLPASPFRTDDWPVQPAELE